MMTSSQSVFPSFSNCFRSHVPLTHLASSNLVKFSVVFISSTSSFSTTGVDAGGSLTSTVVAVAGEVIPVSEELARVTARREKRFVERRESEIFGMKIGGENNNAIVNGFFS